MKTTTESRGGIAGPVRGVLRPFARRLPTSALLCGLTIGCGTPAAHGPRLPPTVEHVGAMREMFASGSAAAQIEVAKLLAVPHTYALGPRAGLRGELLVWDGTVFTSDVDHGDPSGKLHVRVRVDPTATAPFLVWSHVKEWKTLELPDDARSLAGLENWLPSAAAKVGIAANTPFAFLIFGATESATIHVHDLPEGALVTQEASDAAKYSDSVDHRPVQLLGFHATDAAGIYIHHTSHVHLHLRTLLGDVMGHVDELTLAPGAVVKICLH